MWVVVCWHDINHTCLLACPNGKPDCSRCHSYPHCTALGHILEMIHLKQMVSRQQMSVQWGLMDRMTDIWKRYSEHRHNLWCLEPSRNTWIQEAVWWLRCFPSRDLPWSQTLVVDKGMMPGWKLLNGTSGWEQPTSRWRCQRDGGGLQRKVLGWWQLNDSRTRELFETLAANDDGDWVQRGREAESSRRKTGRRT